MKARTCLSAYFSLALLGLSLFLTAGPISAAPTCSDLWLTPAPLSALESFHANPKKNFGENAMLRALAEIDTVRAKLQPLVEEKKWPEALTTIEDMGLRPILFRLQAVGRMYEAQDEDFFGELASSTKELQNGIGVMSLETTLRDSAVAAKNSKLIARTARDYQAALRAFIGLLQESPWIADPKYTAKLRKKMGKMDWSPRKKDREYLVREMYKNVHELNQAVKANEYSVDDLDEGLHKMRRQLRWILITTGAFSGEIRTDRNNPRILRTYQSLVEQPIKYIPDSDAWSQDPIEIPRVVMVAINKLVDEIGAVKDEAEIQVGLKAAGAKTIDHPIDFTKYSQEIQDRLNTEKVLDHLEAALKRQIKKD